MPSRLRSFHTRSPSVSESSAVTTVLLSTFPAAEVKRTWLETFGASPLLSAALIVASYTMVIPFPTGIVAAPRLIEPKRKSSPPPACGTAPSAWCASGTRRSPSERKPYIRSPAFAAA